VEEIQRLQTGPLALAGSGEYTPAMETTDRFLLSQLDQREAARVVVIPTASALEAGAPERWNRMGVEHFTALGAQVTPLPLLTRDDAHDPQIIATLGAADFYYFSGGDPQYLVETLQDTPAWETIRTSYIAGAALGGCSAGAMMLGGYTLAVRELMSGQSPQWPPALRLLPNIAVMPHFDRVAQFVGEELFQAIVASAPAGIALVGIDEDTALVRDTTGDWRVMGRQGVTIFNERGRAIYRAGDTAQNISRENSGLSFIEYSSPTQ
jgi:cyanophycinase